MAGEGLNGLPKQTEDERKALLAAVAQYGQAGREQFEAAKQSVAQSKQAALAGALYGGNPLLQQQVASQLSSPFDRATANLNVNQGNHEALLNTIGARGSEAISTLGAAVPLAQAFLQKQADLAAAAAAAKAAAANQPSYTERLDRTKMYAPELLRAALGATFGEGSGAALGSALGNAASSIGAQAGQTPPPPPMPGTRLPIQGSAALAPPLDIPALGASGGPTTHPEGKPQGMADAILNALLPQGAAAPPANLGSLLSPTGGNTPAPPDLAGLLSPTPPPRPPAHFHNDLAGVGDGGASEQMALLNPSLPMLERARAMGAAGGLDPALLYRALPNPTVQDLASRERATNSLSAPPADVTAIARATKLSPERVASAVKSPDYAEARADIETIRTSGTIMSIDELKAAMNKLGFDPDVVAVLAAEFAQLFPTQSRADAMRAAAG